MGQPKYTPYRDVSRKDWGQTRQPAEAVPFDRLTQEIIAGSLQRIADALENLTRVTVSLGENLFCLRLGIDDLNDSERVTVRARVRAEADRKAREKESRKRAETVYAKALAAARQSGAAAPPESPAHATPIADLSLSVRPRNACRRLGITTAGELAARTADELLECPNFGATSLLEVRERLAKIGLKLADEEA